MTEAGKCGSCRGFGYTKGGPEGPWEKLDCEPCRGTGCDPLVRIEKRQTGVMFWVGHQGFTIEGTAVDCEWDPDLAEKHRDFIVEQLNRALRRLTDKVSVK